MLIEDVLGKVMCIQIALVHLISSVTVHVRVDRPPSSPSRLFLSVSLYCTSALTAMKNKLSYLSSFVCFLSWLEYRGLLGHLWKTAISLHTLTPSIRRGKFIVVMSLPLLRTSVDNFAIVSLQAFPLWKVREELGEIQVPKVLAVLWRIISSDTPGYSELCHIEIHSVLYPGIILHLFGIILDNRFKLLEKDLLASNLACLSRK